jgi:hypothetical protein
MVLPNHVGTRAFDALNWYLGRIEDACWANTLARPRRPAPARMPAHGVRPSEVSRLQSASPKAVDLEARNIRVNTRSPGTTNTISWDEEENGMTPQTTHTPTTNPADEAAITAIPLQMADAWNQGSGEAFAAPFTEVADFVIFEGTHLKGRREIASFHQQVFDTVIRGSPPV